MAVIFLSPASSRLSPNLPPRAFFAPLGFRSASPVPSRPPFSFPSVYPPALAFVFGRSSPVEPVPLIYSHLPVFCPFSPRSCPGSLCPSPPRLLLASRRFLPPPSPRLLWYPFSLRLWMPLSLAPAAYRPGSALLDAASTWAFCLVLFSFGPAPVVFPDHSCIRFMVPNIAAA